MRQSSKRVPVLPEPVRERERRRDVFEKRRLRCERHNFEAQAGLARRLDDLIGPRHPVDAGPGCIAQPQTELAHHSMMRLKLR